MRDVRRKKASKANRSVPDGPNVYRLHVYKVFRSSGAKWMVQRIHLPVHCAPLERDMVIGRSL